MKYISEIRDPVHGYIGISDVEKELIDSNYLQRLRYVKQLAGAYLVYPGATHTRFEHVIGAMHVAGKVCDRLKQFNWIDDDTASEVRVAALLHDVGHGPFSHLFDELWAEKGITHEDVSIKLIRRTDIADILSRNGYSPRKISVLAVGNYKTNKHFLNEIISGSLSTDIMDYLLRDSYFTGVEYGKVDIQRLIDSLCVAEKKLALDKAALYAFEALLIARYEMFKAVYFHRTVRAAQLMLIRAMQLVNNTLGLTEKWKDNSFLQLTDENLLSELCSLDPNKYELPVRFSRAFRDRRLLKCAYEAFLQIHNTQDIGSFTLEEKRNAERKIANKVGVRENYVYLDIPIAPSIPYTAEKQLFSSITLVDQDEGSFEKVPVEKLPLVGAITGYMNIVRIYTTEEYRSTIRNALKGKSLEEIIN
jgi:HD superfamily phosphohydrolase